MLIERRTNLVVPGLLWDGMAWHEIGLTTFVGGFAGLPLALLLSSALPTLLLRALGRAPAWLSLWPSEWPVGDVRSIAILAMCACGGGVVSGGAQWLVTPRRQVGIARWLLSGAVSWALGWPLALISAVLLHPLLAAGLPSAARVLACALAAGFVGGSLAGVVQSMVVWRTARERLGWLLASALGWCLAGAPLALWLVR